MKHAVRLVWIFFSAVLTAGWVAVGTYFWLSARGMVPASNLFPAQPAVSAGRLPALLVVLRIARCVNGLAGLTEGDEPTQAAAVGRGPPGRKRCRPSYTLSPHPVVTPAGQT